MEKLEIIPKAKETEEGILKTLIGLVKDGILVITDVAKRANITVTEVEEK